MRLSRKSPAPGPPPRRMPRPWNPPEAELPGIVPIDTLHFDRSEQAAVAIIGISAYARGFEFFVARRVRPGTPGLDEDPTPEMLRRRRRDTGYTPISLQFSDGRKAMSGRPRSDAEPTGRSCNRAVAAVPRTHSSCGGGHGRWGRPDRWSSSASGRCTGSAKRGVGIDAQADPRRRPPKRPAMARR